MEKIYEQLNNQLILVRDIKLLLAELKKLLQDSKKS
jgi:hypothetical protein